MASRTSQASVGSATVVASKTNGKATKGDSKTPANGTAKPNYKTVTDADKDASYYVTPEFIYGGPFIPVVKPSPFIDSITPMNIPLQGTFTRSYAYFSLKDRLPVILTQIIDDLSKKGGEAVKFIEIISKLKNDLITNKDYDFLTVDTPEAKKWNLWIENLTTKKYFNNNWAFTECYVYRRLYEGCELIDSLKTYDYFAEKKKEAFQGNLKPMCLAAEKVVPMLAVSDKDKRKADFMMLLKLTLWANKCDLSLSVGKPVVLRGTEKDEDEETPEPPPPPPPPPPVPEKGKGKGSEPPKPLIVSSEPFQMILDLKDRLLVDDTSKIADQVVIKSENMQKAIEGVSLGNSVFKYKCSCHRLAKNFGTQVCEEELPPPSPPPPEGQTPEPAPAEVKLPRIPCPAKMTIPNHVMFDIVCDNAGYELFTDLCLATFLLEQKIAQMIRFHVKRMPWFVSDVTIADFNYVIESAANANFSVDITLPPGPEGNVETQKVTAANLNKLGKQWLSMLDSGQFVVMDEEYWTYPHPYCEMKKYDYNLYRKLQYAIGVLFKGDLNYRKLLAERRVNPYTGLEPNLQGFLPAPVIAVRTVKSELVCGLPKGKFDVLNKLDPNWMQKGEYGVIQYCAKAEPLKASDRPCLDYCQDCFGVICPKHETDM